MNLLQMEKDLDDALTLLYTKNGQVEDRNQFASFKLVGAATYLRAEFYLVLKEYFKDPEHLADEVCI
jgi:hypothetical protein